MKLSLWLCSLFLFGLLGSNLVSSSPSVHGGEENNDREEDEDMEGEDSMTDEEFDEAVFMQDKRKSLRDMTPEQAMEEVREIVSLVDRDGDGLVDKDEMIAYLIRISQHNDNQQTNRVLLKADKNKDGKISLEEFWAYSEGESVPDDDESMDENQRSLKSKFNTADENKDGILDEKEFGLFVHPHHSEAMVIHLIQDQIKVYDKDSDGKISRREFLASFNPDDLPEDDMPEWLGEEKANFDHNLDKNGDGSLDQDEVRQWFVPDAETINVVETRHIFLSVDSNRDNKLSVEEVLERFDIFLGSPITNHGFAVHEEL